MKYFGVLSEEDLEAGNADLLLFEAGSVEEVLFLLREFESSEMKDNTEWQAILASIALDFVFGPRDYTRQIEH